LVLALPITAATIKGSVTDVMIHQASAQSLAGIPRRGLCRNGQWLCAGMAIVTTALLFIDIASVTATRQEGLKATIRKRVRASRALST